MVFITNTYKFQWNTSAKQFVERMQSEYKNFWTLERKKKDEHISPRFLCLEFQWVIDFIKLYVYTYNVYAYIRFVKLEDEIKQSKFKNEHHKLGVNIIYTANWLSHHHSRHCKEFDITPEQFNILRILRGQYPTPATVNLLIERMLNKMSNVSRLIEKLREKGLAGRKISKDDRRSCDVLITKKGLNLLTELDKAEKEWNKLISHLSEKEATTLNNLLDKLRK